MIDVLEPRLSCCFVDILSETSIEEIRLCDRILLPRTPGLLERSGSYQDSGVSDVAYRVLGELCILPMQRFFARGRIQSSGLSSRFLSESHSSFYASLANATHILSLSFHFLANWRVF